MRTKRVGIWTLGFSLVIAGGALLYRELTGVDVSIAQYWPLALIGLGLEMIIAQAMAAKAGSGGAGVRLSGLAIIGLVLLLAIAPAVDGPWGISCAPIGSSCTDGAWPATAEHRMDSSTISIDWSGVTSLEVIVKFGSINIRAAAAGGSTRAVAQIVGHAPTATAARSVAESAEVKIQRIDDQLILTGTYKKPTETSSDYAEINFSLEVPANVALDLSSDFAPIDVQGIKTRVEADTRMAAISIEGAAEVIAESEHGRIDVRRIEGPAKLLGTYGAVSANDVTGPVTIESTHGAVDLRNPGSTVSVNATYGAINVRYAEPPTGPGSLTNTYGSITLEHPASSAYQLDAAAELTRITTNLAGVSVTTFGSGSLAKAEIKGGGPLLTLRNNYGRIDIRSY